MTRTAAEITKALGGKWQGRYGTARCPSHDDRDPSLSIGTGENGKVLVRCHAGCDQARVIHGLRERGLWEPRGGDAGGCRAPARRQRTDIAGRRDAARTEAALRIWRGSIPAPGTHVETYLRSRGLDLPSPASLRFHPRLRHPAGGTWPAIVALVTRGTDGEPAAVHRTFLARDGSSKAPIGPTKMMLGPCRGGAVRLGTPTDALMVGEGIETCLSVMKTTGRPAWAALSTSGLRALVLPDAVREVIVLADGDDAGEAAALEAALRWKREGRAVRIAHPPRGLDFNDVLLGQTPSLKGIAA